VPAVESGEHGFDTVGGLVLDRLGRAPRVGDSVSVGEYDLSVSAVDGSRVETVTVRSGADGSSE